MKRRRAPAEAGSPLEPPTHRAWAAGAPGSPLGTADTGSRRLFRVPDQVNEVDLQLKHDHPQRSSPLPSLCAQKYSSVGQLSPCTHAIR